MFKTLRIISILSIAVLMISACNLPSNTATQDPNDPNVVFTAAALTVQAQLTQVSPFSTPTLPPPQPTNTAVTIPTAGPVLATITPNIPPTAVCDQATFVNDVTIPDGTATTPGATFKKTWRLKNTGTCTWSGYTLVFDSGESMAPVIDPIGTVAPGQEVDVSVTFTAPIAPGDYRSYWRIRNPSGVLLPVLNGWLGKGFFVYIKIGSSGYDFYTRASQATWISVFGNLTFGGPDTDVNGFAMYKDGQRLEDGSSPAKVLETSPQQVDNGVITGRYPAYTVVAGEHFTAKIGFLAKPDGTCGTGSVKFQLNYKEAGVLKPLGEWTETCDGPLKSIDIDLTSLAGKSVEFVLGVLANGPAAQDWAVWVAPQIAIP
jgi:hypothetical protein